MITEALINPKSIAIIGASSNLSKPGGKILRNIQEGKYPHPVYPVNPHEQQIQGLKTFNRVSDLPETDLAILLVPPQACLDATEILLTTKKTKALIIISAGFSEMDELGAFIEQQIVKLANEHGASLIGPNCIGVLNRHYHGVFTSPTPDLVPDGCDLISGSGATAVFLMEAGIPQGLKFSNVFSVGNAAQTTVADVLEYLDEHYIPGQSASTKLLYIEHILNPAKLLKHARSLIKKGCRIAAIKAGSTPSGSRAAASHTGAMANPDMAVKALFRKAGIVMCRSRQELIAVASVFKYKELRGKNIAIITHAGGSAVMLTDALSKGGLNVPELSGENTSKLLTYLNRGSSVKNPIDFLATGTAEQLGIIIDYCEHKFSEIDAMVVVFGSPGLFDVENVYRVLSVKLEICKKPIYPVLPSVINARKEISYFLSKGYVNFPDEVLLGEALSNVYHTAKPEHTHTPLDDAEKSKLRQSILHGTDGFLSPALTHSLLEHAGIRQAWQAEITSRETLPDLLGKLPFPVAAKIIGPLHKSDIGGVILNLENADAVIMAYDKIMSLPGAEGVLLQQMVSGTELFIGVKFEPGFGHLILYGLGGIFVEVLQDFQFGMVPLSEAEIIRGLKKLKGYPLFEGHRGKKAIALKEFAAVVCRISRLIEAIPEITELDLNPLIADKNGIFVVDSRIKLEKKIHEKFY